MVTDSYLFTSAGGREINEDSAGQIIQPSASVFALADGLGGHVRGDVASGCVIDTLTVDVPPDGADPREWLRERITEADSLLKEKNAQMSGTMKSTAVALVISGECACWAHTGDSRLYYFHDREIAAITEDHSVAFKKFKQGEITRDMIPSDDDQCALLRSLGGDRSEPDISPVIRISHGDAFLLCSDGAWEYLKDEEILIDLLKSENAQEWVRLLLMRIYERIGDNNDNLSVVGIMVG